MPLAMSSANFTAWLWSTTRADHAKGDDAGNGTAKQSNTLGWELLNH